MKDFRYVISPYIIIPVIFSGISLLSTILGYQVATHYIAKGVAPQWPVAFWAVALIVASLLCGLLIVRVIIYPLEKFYKKTEELGVLKAVPPPEKVEQGDEVGRFTQLFDQVTEFLSRVEARELFPNIIGQSKAIRGVFNQIIKVAGTESTVLILGETGTGKELLTNAIYRHSHRNGKPFVAINCAAIPKDLLESELFGYEKGAFTGANKSKPGKFEIGDKGTVFMDEIGDMPLETQAKILRVLQEGQVERLGGVTPIKVDVRIIAATNKDLSKLVNSGEFREDLYYRLNVFSIYMPPLRERREDIPLLVDHFMVRQGKKITLSPESMQLLTAYHWPGNVRELKNALESASILSGDIIEPVHLPSSIARERGKEKKKTEELLHSDNLDHRLKELEKGMIIEALKRAKGVQKNAAVILGIKERSLWHRIKKYDINATSFKQEHQNM
jgi:transcriptional regulator with PAS, ATPase and Fis domain